MYNDMRYYETRRKKSDVFPFYMCKLHCAGSNAIHPHWHEEAEIIFPCCDGVIYAGGEAVSFESGDILFVNKDMLHHASVASEGVLYALVFDYTLLDFRKSDLCQTGILGPLKNGSLLFPLRVGRDEAPAADIRSCLSDMIRRSGSDLPGTELKIKCSLYEIIFILYSLGMLNEASQGGIENSRLLYVQEAIRFMESNLHLPLSLEEIARSVSISKYHFIKTFGEITGRTPMALLRDLRVEKSTVLLEEGCSVTQTALLCGFNNLSYFIRTFRQRYGVSPGEYRSKAAIG